MFLSREIDIKLCNNDTKIQVYMEFCIKIWASNLIEIQRIETATYINMAYFPGEHFFYIFEKLNVFVKHCSLSLSLS